MPLICVCSPKGGVGKTTLAANLAYSLARTGSKVLALDFDVQNALRLHFGVPLNDERGYVAKALELHDWSQCVLSAGSNIFVLPYGEVSEAQRQAFDEQLTHNDHFLQRGLSALLNYPGLITIADMPPGPSPALKALTGLADLHLIPLLADTDGSVGRAYGVLGGDGILNKLKTAAGFADRVTFIIDENGIITHILDKPDVENHADEVLALL